MEKINEDVIPLPALCIRSLNDKIFEKKKSACREIELLTKELNSSGKTNSIKKLIEYLIQNFINSSTANSKIGGLIAVSSVAIALDIDAKLFLEDIIQPILICTHDCSRDVRYRALESLYNVVKCARYDILIYLNEIMDVIIRLGEDSDLAVKEGSVLMDKLMKDIITENPTFNIDSFVSVIRERIYALTSSTRNLILSWIIFLDSVPDIDMLCYIQDILDGLLKIACDLNSEIRRTANKILDEFFVKLKNTKRNEFKSLIKILLIHLQTDNQSVQNISLKWLSDSIKFGNQTDILYSSPHILAVILPCLSYYKGEIEKSDIENVSFQKENTEIAKSINERLMNLVTNSNQKFHEPNENIEEPFDISKILIVLINELELGAKASPQTKIAILEWIYQIYDNISIELDEALETKLVKILLNTLLDSSDNVVFIDLKVFCKIIFKYSTKENENKHYRKLVHPLIDLFYNNSIIFKDRGPFIICQLCNMVDAKNVYITFSVILLEYEHRFICSMVYIMNTILLTSKELISTREELKNLTASSNDSFFTSLYKTWCYSPVSVISLCFFTKFYQLASDLILQFGNMNITTNVYLEIDQLIQMLETPIFTSLRLDLLDSSKNYYLRKSLYGLLMLLPQSDAFNLLRKRLKCVSSFELVIDSEKYKQSANEQKSKLLPDFASKLQYYIQIQQSLASNSATSIIQ